MSGPAEPGPADQKVTAALAHPLRVQILGILGKEETSPAALTDRLDKPAAVIAYHANVLRESGCIELTRAEPQRGTIEYFYRAVPPAESAGPDAPGELGE